jgi:hypothetical protein
LCSSSTTSTRRRTDVAALVSESTRVDLVTAEIRKCEVVCCSCHRRRTYLRRATTRTPASAERIKDWRVRRNLEWIYSLLGRSECCDCGIADPLVLEFDHIGLKRKNVMTMAWEGYAAETIQIEMNKCEIRCANCHRRKTSIERDSYRFRNRTGPAAPATLDTDPPL